ncbi:MAG TPA: sigma-70 family RNA polymerase sigma factor [Planctomycetota bacterium]|nr:sigma-70 family RNA polymerase sigma factor [Planctomycetota bacterium]
MGSPVSQDVTQILTDLSKGDKSGVSRLMTVLYEDLRSLASRFLNRESHGHTFQPTDLVNEAFLKLVDQTRITWQGKTHFMAVSAQAMRRILVDHARTKHRKKRGGKNRVQLALRDDLVVSIERPDELLAVDEALTKLASLDPTHARILELRLFGGMGMKEISEVLNVSTRTVERHWAMIRAWVLRELNSSPAPE